MRSTSRSRAEHGVLVALAAVVALAVHQLAYLAVHLVSAPHADHVGDHRHLATQWALATPLAVTATAGLIVRQVRTLGLAPALDRSLLAAVSAVLFVGQETIEAVVQTGGPTAAVTKPATWVGLALAPVLATVVVTVLRQASELALRFLERPAAAAPPARLVSRPIDDRAARTRILGRCAPRGPPRLIPR